MMKKTNKACNIIDINCRKCSIKQQQQQKQRKKERKEFKIPGT